MKRIQDVTKDVELSIHENPLLYVIERLRNLFRADKKIFFQTTFYKQQRKKLDLLMDKEGQPIGGKWTYDIENRKKYPKDKKPPKIKTLKLVLIGKKQ